MCNVPFYEAILRRVLYLWDESTSMHFSSLDSRGTGAVFYEDLCGLYLVQCLGDSGIFVRLLNV